MSLSFYAAAGVLVQGFLVSYVIRWMGDAIAACLGFLCTFVSLLGYAFATRGWVMVAFIVPSAFGFLAGVALVTHMSKRMPLNMQGELQGAIAGSSSAASVIAPLLMTQIFSLFSSPTAFVYFPSAPYLLAALFALIGLLLVIQSARRDWLRIGKIVVRS
jgi:DHA1 family tetracycline resistance protein-like MFS transporter